MNQGNHTQPLTPGVTIYLIQLRKHWLITLILAISTACALIAYYYNQDERYTAQTELMLELSPAKVAQFESTINQGIERGLVEASMNTHRERLQSRQMAREILEHEFTPEQRVAIFKQHEQSEETTSEILLDSILDIVWIPDSQIIEISATHEDPQLASIIANVYARGYINNLSKQTDVGNESAINFLQEQSDQIAKEIEATQFVQREFREKNDVISVQKERELTEKRIESLEQAITERRVARLELKSTQDAIENAKENPELLLGIPAIADYGNASKIATELETANTERSILSETLLERHPDMLENEAKISSLQKTLSINLIKASEKINRKLENHVESEAQLQKALASETVLIRKLDQLSVAEQSIERQLTAKQTTGDQLSKRLNEATVSSRLQLTSVRILSEAETPTKASYPQTIAVLGSAGLLFCAVFIGAPFVLELGRTKLSTFSEIEYYINKPVLSHIDYSKSACQRNLDTQREDSQITESFRNLMAQLTLSHHNAEGIYLVSSTEAGEGKSLVAANLALSLAQHGRKTLLIDADLRRPRLHEAFELENKQGLLTWGTESGDPTNLSAVGIINIERNLDILPSGGSTTSPTEFVQDPAFIALLSNLRDQYDAIVLDSPPVGPCSDALILASIADQTIFVVKQNKVHRRRVKAAVERFEKTKAPILGIILNAIRGKSADETFGVNYSQYGVSYGYSTKDYASDKASKPITICKTGTLKKQSATYIPKSLSAPTNTQTRNGQKTEEKVTLHR